MNSDPLTTQLKQLRQAIVHKPPYSSGTILVQEHELVLYYGKKDQNPGRIDFSDVSDSDLARLSQICTPATFGRNDQDVLDESYRKAGKLDTSDFAVKLDLEKNGLMEIINTQLLDGLDAQKSVYAELYKLNIYGEGSFFKSHKDTPRGEKMFGSLVIIYPTRHEGGSLIFRDGKQEWTFDSAQAVSAQEGHLVAYATFFSDVDHEVTLVQSGYRVTVTYNLYFVDAAKPASLSSPGLLSLKTEFEQLLADPTFLPEGGRLGFGLRRVYPLLRMPGEKEQLDKLKPCLKGSDADILRVCDALSLEVGLWMLYQDTYTVAVPTAPQLDDLYLGEDDLSCYLQQEYKAKRINGIYLEDPRYRRHHSPAEDSDEESVQYKDEESIQYSDEESVQYNDEEMNDNDFPIDFTVCWVTKPSTLNAVKNSYVAYGNEASMVHAYGYITLIVEVGKPGERATKAT